MFNVNRNVKVAAAAILAVAAVGYGTSSQVGAATQTASLAVSATVNNNCAITTTALAFGTYDPITTHATADLDNTGTVVIACTKGATTSIELNLGANAAVSQRRLKSGVNFLNYEVYQDSTRATVWGTGTAKLDTGVAPSKAARTYTAYGRVAMNQDVPSGSYTDTVTATVNF